MAAQKKKKSKEVVMSYPTYAYLRSVLEKDKDEATKAYASACTFFFHVPDSVRDKAWDHYQAILTEVKQAQKELLAAARASHRNSGAKMKAFWGK